MFLVLLAACLVNEDLYAARRLALSDRDGDGQSPDQGDCDDNDPLRNTGAPESCDGEDDNCNGVIDEEGTDGAWYLDNDGDGRGANASRTTLCVPPEGTWTQSGDDCNDYDAQIYPGAPERCDGVDQDCDQTLDEDAIDPATWYLDADGDGYGDPETAQVSCEAPAGYLDDGTDCDDTAPATHPDAAELCDGIDNNCDGEFDEPPVLGGDWFPDVDGDGFGDPTGAPGCRPADGLVQNSLDCDDLDNTVHPDAEEICSDGIDNNCDGGAGSCDWPAYLDLDTFPSIRGESLGEWVADTLHRADINADGDPELLMGIGNLESPSGQMDVGGITLWTDPPSSPRVTSDASATWWGDAPWQFVGSASAVCDFNGDGIDDVIVSAIGTDVTDSLANGAIHVLYGPNAITTAPVASLADWSMYGDDFTALFGYNLECVPDMSGDGLPDLILGYGGQNHPDSDNYGMANLITTKDTSLTSYAEVSDAKIYGTDEHNKGMGSGIEAVDYNGDGLTDYAVGCPIEDGYAYLFESPVTGTLTQNDATVTFWPEVTSGATGSRFAALGDHNADGYEDLAIAAQQVGHGVVYLVWGTGTPTDVTLGDAPAKLRGDIRYSFGAEVFNLADINGDGELDLGVGEYRSSVEAEATIFFGPFYDGGVRYQSAADIWLDGDSTDTFYTFVSNIGDWNGDSVPELAVSSSEHDGTYDGEGRILFITGFGL